MPFYPARPENARNPELKPHTPLNATVAISSRHVFLTTGRMGSCEQQLSVAVAQCLEYQAIVAYEYLPPLSDAEWLVIVDVCNGIPNLSTKLQHLPTMVFEDGAALARSIGVDHRHLARQLSAFGTAERIAITEFAQRYWTWHWLHDDAPCIDEVIARVKESIRVSAQIARDLDPPDPN